MCSFITQHNATDVASFKGVCNRHADCRNASPVLFKDESRFSLYRADGRQRVWRLVSERFADVNVVDRVANGGGGVMVWAGVCYGQWTQMHFIDGILNAQRYRDEILRPIVVPFIHDHHLMLLHDNARTHVERICTQFLEAGNIPVLAWPAYSPDMSPIEHVCSGSAYTTACSSSCQYLATSHSHWRRVDQHSTGHNQQPDLCEGAVLHWVRQMVVTLDTDWFSDPPRPPLYSKTAHFSVVFYCGQPKARHTCAIIMLSNQHLYMPHLWGRWIISAKKRSLTQI